jgi:predicted DNA-binding protein (MmcQ/YjbR family)
MDLGEFRTFCLGLPGVTSDFPFDENVLAMRVGGTTDKAGKIFALTDTFLFESMNLKCDPERAIELRERYRGILPGWHMNKRHWNTVRTDGTVPEALLRELIVHSYELVRDSLPRRQREALA